MPSQLRNARERIRRSNSAYDLPIRATSVNTALRPTSPCSLRSARRRRKLLDQPRAQVRVKEIVYHDAPERLRRAPWRRGLRHRGGRYLARMRRLSAVGLMGIILWPTSTSVTIR